MARSMSSLHISKRMWYTLCAVSVAFVALGLVIYAISDRKLCGYVASTHYSVRTRGQPAFLNLGHPYPNEDFTIVIWGSDRSKFSEAPEVLYRGKTICVRGSITKYRGKPEIVVHDPSQITITE